MGRLDGRRVVITGGGSGIGRAIVERFAAEGAKLVAVIRNPEQHDALARPGSIEVVTGDVADYETNANAVRTAREAFGGLDVFIANAGVWDFHKKLASLTPGDLRGGFEEIFTVNVRAPLFAAHAAFPFLAESGGAFIVTGSNACFRAGGGGALYTASKFALHGLVLQLAKEFAPRVRVNGVAPGATDTPLSGSDALGHKTRELNADRGRVGAMAEHIPLARVSAPEDHVGLFVLLASASEAPYVTGAMLVSDGGLTISV